MNREGFTFTHNNKSFYYEISGEGFPFIFLHGLGGNLNQAFDTIQIPDGIQLIALDQRGHGNTECDCQTMNFNLLADDVVALAKHLQIDQFYLGGISMGAGVSINFSLRYPDYVSKLILIRTAWVDAPMSDEILSLYHLVSQYITKENGLELFQTEPLIQQLKVDYPRAADSFFDYFKNQASIKNYQKFKLMPEDQPIQSLDDLRRIKVPALIISNYHDPVHPYEYGEIYSNYIQDVQFYEVTSKAINEENHLLELNTHLIEFLNNER